VPKSGTLEAQVPKIGYARGVEREPSAFTSSETPPAVAKVYIVSFRTHAQTFQVHRPGRQYEIGHQNGLRFDKSSAQAQEMKEGALRVL